MMKNTINAALAVLLTLPSCVQEGPADAVIKGEGNRIYFRSYLPTVTETRAGVITKESLTDCRVTGFNPDDKNHPTSGVMTPYFSDIRFEKDGDGHFLPVGEETCLWPDSKSRLHFFAYYPSTEVMKQDIDGEKFILANYSGMSEGGGYLLDYRIEGFRIAPDIADQVDFIAAYSNGTGQDNGDSGIDLNFSHRLARIEISAWGSNDKYDFEIAGIRIGNALTESDFSLSSLMSASGETDGWIRAEGKQSPVEHIFSAGEATVVLSKGKGLHASSDDTASIMGGAGAAMVIPMAEKIEAWEGKDDPEIDATDYSTDKLYFSVLLRVTNQGEDTVVYPYPNDRDNIPTVYLAVGEDGKIIRRVYLIDGEYYTAEKKNDELKYTPGVTEKVRGYSWAALPVGAKWDAGKIYTYKLNYSAGIGWQDPDDPNPGEPIIERGKIPFAVDVEEWVAAENYNPDLEVPKR